MDRHKVLNILDFIPVLEKSKTFKSILLFSLFAHLSRFTGKKNQGLACLGDLRKEERQIP